MFKKALERVLRYEGCYANHGKDRGGETYKGISRRWHPKWPGWELIDEVKQKIDGINALKRCDITAVLGAKAQERLDDLVYKFYYYEFWKPIQGEALDFISPEIAMEVFDAQVNPTDDTNGAKMLQEALRELGYRLKADGVIGPVTLQTLNEAVETHGTQKILEKFRAIRALHYAREVKHNPEQAVFLEGWIKRALRIA